MTCTELKARNLPSERAPSCNMRETQVSSLPAGHTYAGPAVPSPAPWGPPHSPHRPLLIHTAQLPKQRNATSRRALGMCPDSQSRAHPCLHLVRGTRRTWQHQVTCSGPLAEEHCDSALWSGHAQVLLQVAPQGLQLLLVLRQPPVKHLQRTQQQGGTGFLPPHSFWREIISKQWRVGGSWQLI